MPLLDPEQRIGRREGESVVVANRRADDEVQVHEQVAHHAAHDHHLLRVSLPQVQPRRADEVDELQHHGRQTVEMARPRCALELPRQALDGDAGRVVRRVERAHVGKERDIGLRMVEQRQVPHVVADAAATLVQVAEGVWIDEAGDDDAAVLVSRATDQGELAVVEHAHGRHEADAVADDSPFADGVTQLVGVVDDDHERRRRRPGSGAASAASRARRYRSPMRSHRRSATWRLGSIGQSLRAPSAPNTVTLFSSEPIASKGPPTTLPTIRSSPLSRSLAAAFTSRSFDSAAKPTRKGRTSSGISPTSATMSGLGTSSMWMLSPERLILRWLARAGAKSATAAAMMRMSAPGAARRTASRMLCAVVASTTDMPRGGVTLIAPAISVTDAPRSRAPSAMAAPILPEERLPMKRTGSSGSRVPPAVTTTCSPSRSPARANRCSTASTMVGGSASRPMPVSPDASSPTSGSTTM